jgi:hypothetical protein
LLTFRKNPLDRNFLRRKISAAMKKLSHVLSIIGFSILSGLFGLGVTWIIAALLFIKNNDERLTKIMPLLLAGGAVGLIVGIVVALRVAKSNPEIEEAIENKYIGRTGRMRIFSGAPFSVITTLMFFFGERFLNKVGNTTGAYLGLGIFLVIVATGLFLYDRIPEKLVIPIGIIGWLLTLFLFVWFSFWGSGTFGHSHF